MNHALLYIGGLVIVVLSALVAVPYFVDWNSYRGVFEEEATRVLGRDVRVGGNVNLRLLPSPYVRFEKLKIADVAGEAGESVFRADSFTLWLSVPPLLQGVVEARKIEIKKPVVRLVTDANGRGNWQSIGINSSALKFVPKGVALQSVTLIDGTISYGNAEDGEIARLDGIAGEVAADTLSGPFRFAGTANWQGTARAVRVSTATPDADGRVRFKTSISVPHSDNSYVLAGHLSSYDGKPQVEGELNALVHLGFSAAIEGADAPVKAPGDSPPAATPTAADIPDRPAEPANLKGAPPFEMHAKLKGDAAGLALDDIQLSLDKNGTPQIITGSSQLSWSGKPHIAVSLAARWLDLDRLSSPTGEASTKAPPLKAARAFFENLAGNLPIEADADASLTFDQVTLGAEAISGVKMQIARAGGPFRVKELSAVLPGGTRIETEGVLDGAPLARTYDGRVAVHGLNLGRLIGWGLEQPLWLEGRTYGAFALDGRIKLSGTALEIENANAEFSGQPLNGAMRLSLDTPRTLSLDIEGQRIDAGAFWPGSLETGNLTRLIGMGGAGSPPAATVGSSPTASAGDDATSESKPDATSASKSAPATGPLAGDSGFGHVSLSLRAAEMVDGERMLRDVDADIVLSSGVVSVRHLHVKSTSGLVLDLRGDTSGPLADAKAGAPEAGASGTMTGTVDAPNGPALATLAALSGVASEGDPGLERWGTLTPLKLAGTFAWGRRLATSADLSFDGIAAGGRVIGRALLDGGWRGWRHDAADITLTMDSPSAWPTVVDLIARTGPATPKTAAAHVSREAGSTGRVTVKTIGTAAKGMIALARIEQSNRSAEFSGTVGLLPSKPAEFSGEVVLANADARSVLQLLGIDAAPGLTASLSGAAGLRSSAGTIEVSPRALLADGARINGTLTVADSTGEGQTRRVAADLDVDSATVPGLLAGLLERTPLSSALPQLVTPPQIVKGVGDKRSRLAAAQQKAADAAAVASPALPPTWPEHSFAAEIFPHLAGTANVRFGSLALEPGFAMHDAKLKASFAPGKLTVDSLVAKAAGGDLSAGLSLEKAAAGATLNGTLGIDVASGKEGAKADVAAFQLSFAGQALSPSALISTLAGKGELKVGDLTLTGNTPKSVAAVSEAALQGRGANAGDDLALALKAALKDGQLPLGSLTLPVTLANGNLSLDPIAIETPDGTSTLKAVVELQTLRIDSEWQIAPRVSRALPLPAPEASAVAAAAAVDGPAPGAPPSDAPPAAAAPATERVLLPPLTVSYTGKLRDFAALEPIIATAGLERELSVRKMERDVDELERLRRQDQARAKADLERMKALEEERARALSQQYAAPLPLPGEAEDETADEGAAPEAALPSGGTAEGTVAPQPAVNQPRRTAPKQPAAAKKKPSTDTWKPFQLQPF